MSSPQKSAIGDYALLTLLAKGGMAETYLAERGGKRLVVKKLHAAAALDDDTVKGFIDEARLCSKLAHPNVAQVFDFGEDAGELFLAMEFIHGRSLQQFIVRADRAGFYRLPPTLACWIAARMLEGLHHAHTLADEKGRPYKIVHRDVSPENVLLSFEGEVKVIDFGIAKAQLPGRGETAPGLVKGKYQYLSPEQATAQPLDARSDVFSVAIVLYLMLVGRLPFEGQPHEAMHAIARGQYPRPRTLFPELPLELEAVLVKGLQKDRAQRYASALEMREDLERFLMRVAPGFGPEKLRELMQYLYYDELAAEGVPLPKRAALEVNLSAWRDGPIQLTDLAGAPKELTPPSPLRLVLPAVAVMLALLGVVTYRNLAATPDDTPKAGPVGPPPQILAAARPKYAKPRSGFAIHGGEGHQEVEITTAPGVNPVAQSLGEIAADALSQGDSASALSLARSCLAQDPADADCLFVAAKAALQLDQKDEAEHFARQLVTVAPDHPKALRARNWLEHGGQL